MSIAARQSQREGGAPPLMHISSEPAGLRRGRGILPKTCWIIFNVYSTLPIIRAACMRSSDVMLNSLSISSTMLFLPSPAEKAGPVSSGGWVSAATAAAAAALAAAEESGAAAAAAVVCGDVGTAAVVGG